MRRSRTLGCILMTVSFSFPYLSLFYSFIQYVFSPQNTSFLCAFLMSGETGFPITPFSLPTFLLTQFCLQILLFLCHDLPLSSISPLIQTEATNSLSTNILQWICNNVISNQVIQACMLKRQCHPYGVRDLISRDGRTVQKRHHMIIVVLFKRHVWCWSIFKESWKNFCHRCHIPSLQ